MVLCALFARRHTASCSVPNSAGSPHPNTYTRPSHTATPKLPNLLLDARVLPCKEWLIVLVSWLPEPRDKTSKTTHAHTHVGILAAHYLNSRQGAGRQRLPASSVLCRHARPLPHQSWAANRRAITGRVMKRHNTYNGSLKDTPRSKQQQEKTALSN